MSDFAKRLERMEDISRRRRVDIVAVAERNGLDPGELEAEALQIQRVRDECPTEAEFMQRMAEDMAITVEELTHQLTAA